MAEHRQVGARSKKNVAVVRPVVQSRTSRTAMETPRKQQPSDTSAGQRASNELVKLIRKLRWLGMEEEAQGLQKELERRRATAADSVLATAADTD
jgi:hypothetical protein